MSKKLKPVTAATDTVIRMYRRFGNRYILALAGIIVGCNIIVGSFFLYHFEADAHNALITSYGDAIWLNWMITTTVGLGDFYPVTIGGKIVTAFTGAIGIGMFGLFTSMVSGMLMEFASQQDKIESEDLHEQNARIEHKLDQLLGIESQKKVDEINEFYRNRK